MKSGEMVCEYYLEIMKNEKKKKTSEGAIRKTFDAFIAYLGWNFMVFMIPICLLAKVF